MQNRRVEYFSASCMVGWAVVLAMPGNTLTEQDAFAPFLSRGWTEVQLATFLGVVGSLWLGALWINGHHRRTPVIRCLGSIAGVVMWTHITFMLIEHSLVAQAWSTGVAVYGLLAAFDLFSCARSAADAYMAHIQGKLIDQMVSNHDP